MGRSVRSKAACSPSTRWFKYDRDWYFFVTIIAHHSSNSQTGSNPSRREGGGCGFTLSRSHSCCAVRLVYTQISPGHIWTTLYIVLVNICEKSRAWKFGTMKCDWILKRMYWYFLSSFLEKSYVVWKYTSANSLRKIHILDKKYKGGYIQGCMKDAHPAKYRWLFFLLLLIMYDAVCKTGYMFVAEWL